MTSTVSKVSEVLAGINPLQALPTTVFLVVIGLVVLLLLAYEVIGQLQDQKEGRTLDLVASAAIPLVIAFGFVVLRRMLQVGGAQ